MTSRRYIAMPGTNGPDRSMPTAGVDLRVHRSARVSQRSAPIASGVRGTAI